MSPEPGSSILMTCAPKSPISEAAKGRCDHVPQLEDRQTVEQALHIRGHLTPLVRRRDNLLGDTGSAMPMGRSEFLCAHRG